MTDNMTREEKLEKIAQARELICWDEQGFIETDQKLHLPQPPLFKPAVSDKIIKLPSDFENLDIENDFMSVINKRRSNRVYTEGSISLLQLSAILWCAQGVKSIRGNNYATIRTVPSGGSRHPFEVYPVLLRVEGMVPGLYHYLADSHSLELLEEVSLNEETTNRINVSVVDQKWVTKSSAIFYYSIIPYRGEWRYSFGSHRVMMMDAGHTMQNLTLCATALGLGSCCVGAVDHRYCSEMFGLDGKEEYMQCCVPVGTVDPENEDAEQAFYAFLKEGNVEE